MESGEHNESWIDAQDKETVQWLYDLTLEDINSGELSEELVLIAQDTLETLKGILES